MSGIDGLSLSTQAERTEATVLDAKRNLIERASENFKPPVFKPNTSALSRLENWLRRFLDLQAGTGWHDLKGELAGAQGTLLDIGCGAQVYRPLVPAHVQYRGIDTIDAKERFGYAVPDTYYFEGNDWNVPGASIDVALCTEVLEHIDAPLPFLRQIAHVLRPGGRLLLTVPFAARWHFIPYDYWRYTPSSLRMLLSEAGFDRIRVTARGNPLTVACYKVMALPLMLLFDSGSGGAASLGKKLVGLVLLPLLGIAALIGNLTLYQDWGDDCLGYTVAARRTADAPVTEQRWAD